MGKIRINELARQLEIPSHAIVEMLPEVGVTEKKTHSSSIDEPVAELIRKRLESEREAQSAGGGTLTAVAAPPLSDCLIDSPLIGSPCRRFRSNSATGSSIELECVFFSVTPTSGNISTITCDGISSCLASSLMRILLIF